MRAFVLALTLLMFAPTAYAADKCLTGASVLGDQRAMAILRADTESACPCAAFTGAPGAGRVDYQRCARGVLSTALSTSALRTECGSIAKRVNRGATCGTTNVTCGRVRTSGAPIARCKVQPASRCTSESLVADACTNETHCDDVVAWGSGTCEDPRDPGPYAAGVRIVTYTKDSAYAPGTPRNVATAIWYPAPAGASPIDPFNAAVLNAPLDGTGGPYPLVMFSHGSCGFPQQSTFLTANLASHGFIVVAPAHVGNTIYQFPACGTPAAQTASFVERPQDVKHVLDALLAANLDSGSPFFGAIDPTKLAMTGHSFGGLTTHLVVTTDSRWDVAIPMAPASLFNPIITIPQLTLLGATDSTVSNPTTIANFADDTAPKYLVEIAATGHYAFSNGCLVAAACNPPVTLTQDEAHEAVLRWVLPFLRRYLENDLRFRPLLEGPPPPGTTITRDF